MAFAKRAGLIQVGQVLDKYELLERVGQGGMAVVYRGIDRSLKRTVAVKILHKHLAESKEARDRFEREAQAVAKLRHDNILEIFDYASKADSESYIVTEFIDGQTLKQFFTERPITYPEVGAMIILQVARALAHAHAGGILHRDVKPENIMIRSDGVVKLMDFGISHMVDLERLTVTGQLLGSPAYMAPEHVEGRPLDFRTDVFAVGIVLYQLTVGKLPFEGKNPHEVLKRIAECKFVDPRVANPRLGNRLGRIILRAMAAEPNDRYPAIGEMVVALEAYLDESGIESEKVTSELARYFKSPGPYEQALHERLVDHLTRRGQKLLADGEQAPALDVFDRILTIDPKNEKVLAILDGLNRRARAKTIGIAVAAVAVISAGGYAIHKRSQPPPPEAPPDPVVVIGPNVTTPNTNTSRVEQPPVEELDAGVDIDAAGTVVAARPDAAQPVLDAAVTVATKTLRIRVIPAQGSRVKIGANEYANPSPEGFIEGVVEADARVSVRNPCCQDVDQTVPFARANEEVLVSLQALPARLTAKCDVANASVTINGTAWKLNEPWIETFDADATSTQKTFKVSFAGDGVDMSIIETKVGANQAGTVTCQKR